jgi:hypothetical protein
LIIGARDEAALPPPWWQNTLFSFPSCKTMQLEMVGPDISSKWDDQAVKLLTSADGIDHKQLLTIKSPLANKSTLTNHPDMRDKLLNSDVFVLFNPVSSLFHKS